MRRFGLVMDDALYIAFYAAFPDQGRRTNLLRKCVHQMVKRAKVAGELLPIDIETIADKVAAEEDY
jgi:hypothetical protein